MGFELKEIENKKSVAQDIISKDIWPKKKMGLCLRGGRWVRAHFAVKCLLS